MRKAVVVFAEVSAKRDLPRFKEGLARLGFDDASAEYEKLLQLWDEHARSSRA